jgi:hypothetical protein
MTAQQPVVPPEGTKDGTWHWLLSGLGFKRVVGQWRGGNWLFSGLPGGDTPTFLRDLGWTYVGPVQPPATEGGDG